MRSSDRLTKSCAHTNDNSRNVTLESDCYKTNVNYQDTHVIPSAERKLCRSERGVNEKHQKHEGDREKGMKRDYGASSARRDGGCPAIGG